MSYLPALRSPYARVGRRVYIGRMFDKIRLHARGRLPADYQPWLGHGFDARACAWWGVTYDAIAQQVHQTPHDEEVLAWLEQQHGRPTDEACEIWNGFMRTRGWRDEAAALLARRREEAGFSAEEAPTFFDLIEAEEGRSPLRHQAWQSPPPRVLLLCGVAGCGKTTVGEHLAGALGWRFVDADDFHPTANRTKMSRGEALTEADRLPWIEALVTFLRDRVAENQSLVLACSGLREAYRQRLCAAAPAAISPVLLHGSREVLHERLSARQGHFMPPTLLDSQLATLELPDPALVPIFDISPPLPDILQAIISSLNLPVSLPAALPS